MRSRWTGRTPLSAGVAGEAVRGMLVPVTENRDTHTLRDVVTKALFAYAGSVPFSIAGVQISFLLAIGAMAALGFAQARSRVTPATDRKSKTSRLGNSLDPSAGTRQVPNAPLRPTWGGGRGRSSGYGEDLKGGSGYSVWAIIKSSLWFRNASLRPACPN